MSAFSVSQLCDEDWQRAKSIRLRALHNAPPAFFAKLRDEQALTDAQWQARYQRKDIATFIAKHVSSKEDIGLVVGAPYETEAGLYSLWVEEKARRLGIGNALVDSVIEWARSANFNQLYLDVGNTNQAAIQLYQRKQFRLTGTTNLVECGQAQINESQMVFNLNSSG